MTILVEQVHLLIAFATLDSCLFQQILFLFIQQYDLIFLLRLAPISTHQHLAFQARFSIILQVFFHHEHKIIVLIDHAGFFYLQMAQELSKLSKLYKNLWIQWQIFPSLIIISYCLLQFSAFFLIVNFLPFFTFLLII